MRTWLNSFDERQRKEIEFSELYAKEFGHGTDGHNAKMIIAKMVLILDKIESVLLAEDHPGKLLKVETIMGLQSVNQETQNEDS